jgi:uridine phosphorylase
MGEFVVCEKAIRDEGTSHHYVESETYARPSDSVVTTIRETLREREEPFHVGPSWTTDAVYQETRAEVERYADQGVLTVEMEAATVFTVAAYRGVDAGAMFVVSDYLGPSEWEPNFHLAGGPPAVGRHGEIRSCQDSWVYRHDCLIGCSDVRWR